ASSLSVTSLSTFCWGQYIFDLGSPIRTYLVVERRQLKFPVKTVISFTPGRTAVVDYGFKCTGRIDFLVNNVHEFIPLYIGGDVIPPGHHKIEMCTMTE